MFENLEDFLGELGASIRAHPVAFACLWIVAVFVVTAQGARAVEVAQCVTDASGNVIQNCVLEGVEEGGQYIPVGSGASAVWGYRLTTGDDRIVNVFMNLGANRECPAGWSCSGSEQTPPATASGSTQWQGGFGGQWYGGWQDEQSPCGGSGQPTCAPQAACDAVKAAVDPAGDNWDSVTACSSGTCNFTGGPPGGYTAPRCVAFKNGSAAADFTLASQAGCPSGYSNQGGTCILTDANVVMKPANNKCEVIKVGNTFQSDARDPDCAGTGSAAEGAALVVSGSQVDAGSSPGTVRMVANGDGSVTLTTCGVNGSNTQCTSLTIDSAGVVTGKATNITEGVGTGNNPATAAEAAACGGPGQPECSVKVDEAGTSDGSGAAAQGAAVVSQLGTLTQQANAAAASGDASAFGISGYQAPTDDESKVAHPFEGSSTCVNPVVEWRSEALPMPICTVTQPLKEILGWALSVFAALYAWYRFARDNGAGAGA